MKKPLILAHRGARLEAPENTLPAFAKAKEMGADGVELDVLLCKDQHWVITHNDDLRQYAGTQGRVSRLNLRELKGLDFGSHFSPQFRNERIPTLAELFELLRGHLLINVEIKKTNILNNDSEDLLIRLIRDMKMEEQVWISSFNIFALRRMARKAPELRRGYLFYEGQDFFSRRGGWDFLVSPQSWNISRALVRERTIEDIHRKGREAWIWTVNEAAEAEKFSRLGADVLITDDPRLLLSLRSKSS